MREEWRDIAERPGAYQVSSLGRMKSIARKVKTWNGYKSIPGMILKLRLRNGYLTWKNKAVARMVAAAFIKKDQGMIWVNHINGNKIDNRRENLEWCTPSQNSRHAWRTGLCNEETRAKMSAKAKLRTGKLNSFFGKNHSADSKRLMSLSKISRRAYP